MSLVLLSLILCLCVKFSSALWYWRVYLLDEVFSE